MNVAARFELPSAAGHGVWPGEREIPEVVVAARVEVVVPMEVVVVGAVVVDVVGVGVVDVVGVGVFGVGVDVVGVFGVFGMFDVFGVVGVVAGPVVAATLVVAGFVEVGGAAAVVGDELCDGIDVTASVGAATLIVSSVWPKSWENSAAPMSNKPVTNAVPIAVRRADGFGEGSGSRIMQPR